MNDPSQRSKRRDIHGIVLLDKPPGYTSNQALQAVKRVFQARKGGHTGSLDPLATGLLPICLGEATKVSGYLLDADKRYLAGCMLGVRTTTGDAEGEVLATCDLPAKLARTDMELILARLRGEITQIPPMYSALKHQGQRLYTLARKGEEVARTPRIVQIHALELLEFNPPQFSLAIHCSKGTYVRTLAEDIGTFLGCGAHITSLRRTGLGTLDAEGMYTLSQLQTLAEQGDEVLMRTLNPIDLVLTHWPRVELDASSAHYLRQGQAVFVPNSPTEGWLRIYDNTQNLLGLGCVLDDGRIAPKRLFQLQALDIK